jgi:hypothetical protein
VGEVDQAQDAVNHGIADGDKGVEAAQGQAIDELLEKGEKIHLAIIIKIQANWQLTEILPVFLQPTGIYLLENENCLGIT